MPYCPWNGVKDCGCGAYPWPIDGKAPPRCEELMAVYIVGAYIRPQGVSDAKMAAYRAWIKAGQPRLEPDEADDGEPDYAQGG